MSFLLKLLILLCLGGMAGPGFAQTASQPIAQHPQNSHYFFFRGKPVVLITSAEHYGAVLNLDFDFVTYLNTLQADQLNYTRIFSGAYIEIPGAFDISKNTLAPAVNRLVAPWARSDQGGFFSGGNKFDLNRWDPAYFKRLHQIVTEAGKRGIVVEMTFFSSLYSDDKGWFNSPLHPRNNINNTTDLPRQKVHTLENGNLLTHQEKLVRKLVQELNAYDNVIFEVQNEPWAENGQDAGAIEQNIPNAADWQKKVEIANPGSLAWQDRVIEWVTSTESKLPYRHLIAQNISNFYYTLTTFNPKVSIFNFHYALPEAAWQNQEINKVIGFDESGFAGSADVVYRQQAWRFMLAGGGLFNNLDYSFTVPQPNGTDVQSAPGGGSPALRRQLGILKTFLESFDFISMKPMPEIIQDNPVEEVQAFGTAGKVYALYVYRKNLKTLAVNLPAGNYQATWINVTTGQPEKLENINVTGEKARLTVPAFEADIALKIVRKQGK